MTNQAEIPNTRMGNEAVELDMQEIFLSHTGVDKSFVVMLHKILKERYQSVFIDVDHHDSLPIGERFPERIFHALKGCKLAVFVLSESFVMKKWPMMELMAAVQEFKKKRSPKIFPLFYKLHVNQIDDKKNADNWKKWNVEWKKWNVEWKKHAQAGAAADSEVKFTAKECGEALKFITKNNGISMVAPQHEPDFMEKAADLICQKVNPDIWGINDMQNQEELCEVVHKKFHPDADAASDDSVVRAIVLGMWGNEGSGKTKISNALCHHYYKEYSGLVHCMELDNSPTMSSILKHMKAMLQSLTGASKGLLDSLTGPEKVINVLKKRMKQKKFFLAIDNVTDDENCKRNIKHMLVAITEVSEKGTKVLLTAKDKDFLQTLTKDCGSSAEPFEVPKLDGKGAISILLRFATDSSKSWDTLCFSQKQAIKRMCSSSLEQGDFSPMLAKSIGLLIKGTQPESIAIDPTKWPPSLLQSEAKIISRIVVQGVFNAIKKHQSQLFYIDAALYDEAIETTVDGICNWLSIVHGISQNSVMKKLEELRKLKVLDWDEDEDDEFDPEIVTDSQFARFAKMEALENPNKWRWFYYNRFDSEEEPDDVELEKVEKMALVGGDFQDVVEVVSLGRCVQVVAFIMAKCHEVQDLTVQYMKKLQVLEIEYCENLQEIEGLEKLEELTCLHLRYVDRWSPVEGVQMELGHFKNLRSVDLIKTAMKKPPVLEGCRHLCELHIEDNDELEELPHSWVGLRHLAKISFASNPKITSLPNLSPLAACLSYLDLQNCGALIDIQTVESLTSLCFLHIGCCKFELSPPHPLPDLSKLLDLEEIRAFEPCDTVSNWIEESPAYDDEPSETDEFHDDDTVSNSIEESTAYQDEPATETDEIHDDDHVQGDDDIDAEYA